MQQGGDAEAGLGRQVPNRREAQAKRTREQAGGRIQGRKPESREPDGPQAGGDWPPREARAARQAQGGEEQASGRCRKAGGRAQARKPAGGSSRDAGREPGGRRRTKGMPEGLLQRRREGASRNAG